MEKAETDAKLSYPNGSAPAIDVYERKETKGRQAEQRRVVKTLVTRGKQPV